MSSHRRLPVVTTSELRVYRRCAREHHYRYRLRYRPTLSASEALRIGSATHVGWEAYWLALSPTAPLGMNALGAALGAMLPHAINEYDAVRLETMMLGYHARWATELAELEVLDVEREFTAPLVNPATGAVSKTYELAGKIDVLVRRRATGAHFIVEHKSTTESIEPGSTYWQALAIDNQISMYYVGARAMGYDPIGAIYDVAVRPRHQPLTATPVDQRKYRRDGKLYANQREDSETLSEFRERLIDAISSEPHRFYQQSEVVRLASEETEAAYDVWQTTRMMRESELSGRYPRNADACKRFGSMCDYFPVCTSRASLDDPTIYTQAELAHPELSADIQAPPPPANEGPIA